MSRLGLSPEATGALVCYLDVLASWARRANLTAAGSASERVALLVAPVLPLLRLLTPGPLLDVGSGNGSPGLVLALLRPELPATLLEPRAKRWAFLREATRAVGRPDIRVLRDRHDTFAGPPAQNLTLRGLRLPLEELAPLVREGGRVLVVGRSPEEGGSFSREDHALSSEWSIHVFRRGAGPGDQR